MGKNTRRALLGFAGGALAGAQNFFQTKAAQEAEALREQRLAAIRAEERGQDRQFQRETMTEQNAMQAARDQTLAEQQAARDDRINTYQTTRDTEQAKQTQQRDVMLGSQRQAEIAAMAKNQPASNTGYVEGTDAKGVPFAMTREEYSKLTPEQRGGHRFRGQYGDAAAAEVAPAAAGAAPPPTGGGMKDPTPEGARRYLGPGKYEVYQRGQWVPST